MKLSEQLIGSFSNRRRPGRMGLPIVPLPIQHFPGTIKSDTNTGISKRGRCAYCLKFSKKEAVLQ